jgi:hypothetical protein
MCYKVQTINISIVTKVKTKDAERKKEEKKNLASQTQPNTNKPNQIAMENKRKGRKNPNWVAQPNRRERKEKEKSKGKA